MDSRRWRLGKSKQKQKQILDKNRSEIREVSACTKPSIGSVTKGRKRSLSFHFLLWNQLRGEKLANYLIRADVHQDRLPNQSQFDFVDFYAWILFFEGWLNLSRLLGSPRNEFKKISFCYVLCCSKIFIHS